MDFFGAGIITSVVEKENNVNEQNFNGEANWSGDWQMSLVMSIPSIFNDGKNLISRFLDFRLFINSETNR